MVKPRLALALAAATLIAPALALKSPPDIRADTNRDGVVDVTGDSDKQGKSVWTASRGAIFLPNIGDTFGRCSSVDALGKPLTNKELASCNDASGDSPIAPEYFAPLRTLPVKDIGDKAIGYVSTYPEQHAEHVRIFWQPAGGNWTYIDPEFEFNATSLRTGLKLGIDSRHVVTDSCKWDGKISVRFTVLDGKTKAVDDVAMKLAPVLFHHHLQAVDTLITQYSNDSGIAQKRFVKELDEARAKTSITKPLLLLPDTDIWAQDLMEPGYASMPGPGGKPISIRVIVRTAESTRDAGRQVFTVLRGKGVGGYQPLGKGTFGFREINSGGNIETIPPYVSKVTGVKYPVGRIITGKQHSLYPAEAQLKFYSSQGLQSPLILETGWLVIGHVDEFLSFLPANNSLGFTISIADPMLALNILRDASAAGYGKALAYSVGPDPNPQGSFGQPSRANVTIDDVLKGASTSLKIQQYADRYIRQNLKVLLAETGLKESDVIRIPTLFEDSSLPFPGGYSPSDPPGSPAHYTIPESGGYVLGSFYPAAVNGVVIGKSYIGSKAFGPVIKGIDIFQSAVEAAYKRAGMNALFIDDYYSHHIAAGDVHCGSNTLRETAVKWW